MDAYLHGDFDASQAVSTVAARPCSGTQPLPSHPGRRISAHSTTACQDHEQWPLLPRRWALGDFRPIRKLYKGYASKVYLAEDNGSERRLRPDNVEVSVPRNGARVVLKVYDLMRLSPLTRYQLEREVRLHESVSHPNVVSLYAAFEETNFKTLVLEYAGRGDLYSCLQRHRTQLDEAQAVSLVVAPTLAALQHLHARGIIHRDIKPENLLLTSSNTVKLADFGLSVSTRDEIAVTRAGTLDYMAPEVMVCPLKRLPTDYKERNDLAYGPRADAWSVGVLAYELLAGRPPWVHHEEPHVLAEIRSGPVASPAGASPEAASWLRRALTANVAQRATVDELLAHPWITGHTVTVAAAAAAPSSPASPAHAATRRRGGRRAAGVYDGDSKARGMASDSEGDCRSPSVLHVTTHDGTPQPWDTPTSSVNGPAALNESPGIAGRLRSRGRPPAGAASPTGAPGSLKRQLSALNPGRAPIPFVSLADTSPRRDVPPK